MSFDTRAGTRGGWQPGTGGAVGRWLTKRAANRIRRSGKAMGLGFDALVLTTIGRKTGAERTTPVGRFPGNGRQLADRGVGGRGGPRTSGVVLQPRGQSRPGPDRDGRPHDSRYRRATPRRRSARRRGGRSPPPCPASRSTSRRPTVSCRSSAWCLDPAEHRLHHLCLISLTAAAAVLGHPGHR